MSKYIVIVMMFVVIAMFYKGVEVLGPSNTNRDVLFEGDTSRSCTVLGFENPGDLTLFALSGKAQIK